MGEESGSSEREETTISTCILYVDLTGLTKQMWRDE